MLDNRLLKQALQWKPADSRIVGRQRDTWQRTFQRDKTVKNLDKAMWKSEPRTEALEEDSLPTYGRPEARRGLSKQLGTVKI